MSEVGVGAVHRATGGCSLSRVVRGSVRAAQVRLRVFECDVVLILCSQCPQYRAYC